ncbi:hypothetical protein RJ639_031437 [Escallonia herrerae]|uniref:F-box domain-containing protein n=1 Tax=Escallonia herrerae TaxID=1293975 RepID=A0AA89BNQ9_9ASTE|nr:hypothetical protein RJ639_031437 [Escallonia herrerae]
MEAVIRTSCALILLSWFLWKDMDMAGLFSKGTSKIIDKKSKDKRKKEETKINASGGGMGTFSGDIMLEILRRLPPPTLLTLRCVSAAWECLIHEVLAHSWVPRDQLITSFSGILAVIITKKDPFTEATALAYYPAPAPSLLGQYQLLRRDHGNHVLNSILISCIVPRPLVPESTSTCEEDLFDKRGLVLISSCNGLLLFRTTSSDDCNGLFLFRTTSSDDQRPRRYTVCNPTTGDSVVIRSSDGSHNSGPNNEADASLVFNPLESDHFKIIEFPQEHKAGVEPSKAKHMNIFSSETNKWCKFEFYLRDSILQTTWSTHTVYHERALFKISTHHLLKFVVAGTQVANVKDRAYSINLPAQNNIGPWLPSSCIGLISGRLHYAVFNGFGFQIWMLEQHHHYDDPNHDYFWSLKHRISRQNMVQTIGNSASALDLHCFHPYSDIIFIGCHSKNSGYALISYCFSSDEAQGRAKLTTNSFRGQILCFPFMACYIPLTNWRSY